VKNWGDEFRGHKLAAFEISMGLLFGLIGTITLHLAKAMERHGIDLFNRKMSRTEKGKKPLIWFIGFGLNNTQFIWQLIGNSFAPASVYVSVFGVGLVIVLIYSVRILKEQMTHWDWIGSGLILFGTLFVGFLLFNRPEIIAPMVNYDAFTILMIASAIILTSMIAFSYWRKKAISLFFGLAAGSCGAIDNVLKHSGIEEGNIWIIVVSFAIGFGGFLITQWGYINKADASKLVPAYNASYIIIPVLFESWIIVSIFTQITIPQIIGISIIILGIIFMTAIKKWKIGSKIPVTEIKKEDQI
jgi:drug/metabolite transporter (DMT)-like permease